jgi:hypothetical protein
MRRGVLTLSRRTSQATFSVRPESMLARAVSSAQRDDARRAYKSSAKKRASTRLAQVHEVEGL